MRVRFVQTLDGLDEAHDALESLAFRNAREMRRGRIPPLYKAGVRYATGSKHRQLWKSASQVYGQGHGDCADLAAYRVAELRRRGEKAKFRLKSGGRPGLYHVVVVRGNGQIEDPSRILGMRGAG